MAVPSSSPPSPSPPPPQPTIAAAVIKTKEQIWGALIERHDTRSGDRNASGYARRRHHADINDGSGPQERDRVRTGGCEARGRAEVGARSGYIGIRHRDSDGAAR